MDILEDDKMMSYDEFSDDHKYEIDEFIVNRCWRVTDQSLILKAIQEILVRLPEDVLDVLAYERDINVILPECFVNTIYKHNVPIISNTSTNPEIKMKETWFVVLSNSLHDMSYKAIVGTIVHEFAHVYLKHFGHASHLHNEIETAADEIASTWGFRDEIESP